MSGTKTTEPPTSRRVLKTHCPKGHPYDEENTRIEDHKQIRRHCRTCDREKARAAYVPVPYHCGHKDCARTTEVLNNGWIRSSVGLSGSTFLCPDHWYNYCSECHRKMRKHGWTREDHPGTVLQNSSKECASCYNRRQRGTKAEYISPEDKPHPEHAKILRRVIRERFDNPDDIMLITDALGIGGEL
jgi:hypothetical protein